MEEIPIIMEEIMESGREGGSIGVAAPIIVEEILESGREGGSIGIAAPLIFLFTIVVQFIPMVLKRLKKRRAWNAEQIQLRKEIKELLKEAGSLSNPSTFAQAAKLRRMAAAKEKELLKSQEAHGMENTLSYKKYSQALTAVKVTTHLVLIIWFWGHPIASVSQQLLQPFGKVLSWRGGESANGHIMVGIIPWLIISSRVSKFVCHKLYK